MKAKVESYTAPSAWASYLINGDASGITSEDQSDADAFVSWVGAGSPVDCEDAGFRWYFDASHLVTGYRGADCQRYVFLRREA